MKIASELDVARVAPRAEAQVVVPADEDVAPIIAELDKEGVIYSLEVSDRATQVSIAANGAVYHGGAALRDFFVFRPTD